MFPGIYDFEWNFGHVVFLGIFYAVLAVVFTTLVVATARAIRRLRARRHDALLWHAEFDDLPAAARRCRHEIAGEVASRVCGNGFDCRSCEEHAKFVAVGAGAPMAARVRGGELVAGFAVEPDRLYHRGHTWIRREPDGTFTVGLDDLGSRLLASAGEVDLPPVGSLLTVNGTAWTAHLDGSPIRVLAPVDGEVVATGGVAERWLLKVRPSEEPADLRHLLGFEEAKGWMLREAERLQIAMAGEATGATLADGGAPVDDLARAIPPSERDAVCGLMLLEP